MGQVVPMPSMVAEDKIFPGKRRDGYGHILLTNASMCSTAKLPLGK